MSRTVQVYGISRSFRNWLLPGQTCRCSYPMRRSVSGFASCPDESRSQTRAHPRRTGRQRALRCHVQDGSAPVACPSAGDRRSLLSAGVRNFTSGKRGHELGLARWRGSRPVPQKLIASPAVTNYGSVIDWLLDSDPSIRWQVMRDLLDTPESEWRAERAKVETEGWGARLLSYEDEDGQWAGGAFSPSNFDAREWQELGQPWTNDIKLSGDGS